MKEQVGVILSGWVCQNKKLSWSMEVETTQQMMPKCFYLVLK